MTDEGHVVAIIVDDNGLDRYMVRRYLECRSEFGECLEAATGVEFINDICDSHKLDGLSPKPILILLDINMPMLDGFETAVALQQKVEAGEVPASLVVMIFTSSDNPEDRRRAEEIDIVKGFIVKPIDDDNVAHLLKLYQEFTRSQ
ncbi:MAG: response regulator [Pseudomonadota bacterium]